LDCALKSLAANSNDNFLTLLCGDDLVEGAFVGGSDGDWFSALLETMFVVFSWDFRISPGDGTNVFAVGAPTGEGALVVPTTESMRIATVGIVVVILGGNDILRDALLNSR
jgi:hypothetical protein